MSELQVLKEEELSFLAIALEERTSSTVAKVVAAARFKTSSDGCCFALLVTSFS